MIKITEFAERHFDKDFGGTKILDFTPKEVEEYVNNNVGIVRSMVLIDHNGSNVNLDEFVNVKIIKGYADFCRLLIIRNLTNAKVGSMPITIENYQYLRSGYSARRESELPTFSRWFELPLEVPKADYLVLVLYSKEQIDYEKYSTVYELEKNERNSKIQNNAFYDITFNNWLSNNNLNGFDADWGVVAILGQSHDNEEPMKPETMLRNALGIKEGGSGTPLDRKKYLKSVEFWSKNATIK